MCLFFLNKREVGLSFSCWLFVFGLLKAVNSFVNAIEGLFQLFLLNQGFQK